LAAHTAAIKNGALRETLSRGVAFYHEGLSESERSAVRTLFSSGAVQICVVEQSLCWGLDLSAFMVIIMDTQKFNGAEHRYVDYPIPDMLQVCSLSIWIV
jgi:pre-mRNA-splicing helicase BRR2